MNITDTNSIFAANIRYLRTKYAMPQKTLSKLTGISLPILRMTERGEVCPRLTDQTLARLCAIFDTTPDALLHSDLS